jgi:hypothetical protein
MNGVHFSSFTGEVLTPDLVRGKRKGEQRERRRGVMKFKKSRHNSVVEASA